MPGSLWSPDYCRRFLSRLVSMNIWILSCFRETDNVTFHKEVLTLSKQTRLLQISRDYLSYVGNFKCQVVAAKCHQLSDEDQIANIILVRKYSAELIIMLQHSNSLPLLSAPGQFRTSANFNLQLHCWFSSRLIDKPGMFQSLLTWAILGPNIEQCWVVVSKCKWCFNND